MFHCRGLLAIFRPFALTSIFVKCLPTLRPHRRHSPFKSWFSALCPTAVSRKRFLFPKTTRKLSALSYNGGNTCSGRLAGSFWTQVTCRSNSVHLNSRQEEYYCFPLQHLLRIKMVYSLMGLFSQDVVRLRESYTRISDTIVITSLWKLSSIVPCIKMPFFGEKSTGSS